MRAVTFEDAVLVRQVQAGEVHAFTELVRKYQDRVYNACRRICGDAEDAADMTQEAFMRAFESLEDFRGKSAFFTWIFRIAVNLAISHRRKARTRSTVSLDDAGPRDADDAAGLARIVPDVAAPNPADAVPRAEMHAEVARALGALEPDHRAVLVLRDVEGLDYQEIADVLELPVGTVKSRIYRARLALRARLEPFVAEESA